MTNSSSPTVAGILNIVAGVIGVFSGVGMILVWYFFTSIDFFPTTTAEEFPFELFQAIYMVWGIVVLILSVLSIIGGIYALQRKLWGLALAASIASILVFFPVGVVAVIFVGMSKQEFN